MLDNPRSFRNVLIFATIILMFLLVAIGCSSSNSAKQEENQQNGQDVQQTQEELPKTLSIGAHAMGSKFNVIASGVATALSRNTPIEVRAVATSGPAEFTPMLKTGEMDMGILNTYEAMMAYYGQGEFGELSGGTGFPIRILSIGSINLVSGITAKDTGINTAMDLKGKRYVGEFSGSPALSALQRAFLANHNLTRNDVEWVSVPGLADGIRGIIEGRIDASTVALGVPIVQELDVGKGAKFLSIDPAPAAMARLQEEFPAYSVLVEPAPNKIGIVEPTYMMAYDIFLVVREDLADNVAYTLLKALWENQEELLPIHPDFETWAFISDNASIPFHPGAIKFFQEQGLWNDKLDELQKKLLTDK